MITNLNDIIPEGAPRIYLNDEVFSVTITWTPKMAREVLALTNTHNRSLRASVVDAMKRDVTNGRWEDTGDPIQFCNDGTMSNGQHRMATIASMPDGFSINQFTTFGLKPSAQAAIDQGAPRGLADVFKLDGTPNYNKVSSIIRALILWDAGQPFSSTMKASAMEAREYRDTHQAEHQFLQSNLTSIRKVNAPATPTGVAALLFWRLDPEDAREFIRLASVGGYGEHDPINVLIAKLGKMAPDSNKSGHQTSRRYLAVLIMAWNHWRKGNSITLLREPKDAENRVVWTTANMPHPI